MNYAEVKDIITGLDIGELITLQIPDNLRSFRKYLSEISAKEHKKFTTKVRAGQLHLMRVKYFSIAETLNSE